MQSLGLAGSVEETANAAARMRLHREVAREREVPPVLGECGGICDFRFIGELSASANGLHSLRSMTNGAKVRASRSSWLSVGDCFGLRLKFDASVVP